MNKKGEAFITKVSIGAALFSLFVVFIAVFMSNLSSDYGRTIEGAYDDNFDYLNSDVSAVQQEAQEIQKSSGLDAGSSDLAQAQGVLSASEKAADTQTIITKALSTIQEILPFDDFVLNTILIIITIAFLGAVIYIFIGRWI